MSWGDRLPAWFVVFADTDGSIWWHRPLKRGFRHCWLLGWDAGAGRWLLLDPGFKGAYLRALDDAQAGLMWAELHGGGYRVLHVASGAQGPVRPRLLLSCVSAVEAVLGVDAGACAFTPWALYRHLVGRGATAVI
jgi:hypothetical protein